jgi:hexosaminidase
MTFPRLAGDRGDRMVGTERRDWDSFRRRLAAHGPRWSAQGIAFHRSPQIDWA